MIRRWVAAALFMAALTVPQAGAETVAEFYKGKQINLVVGYGPGGGYDVYARVVGRHIGKHIPGRPAVVVQNMPGAGSLRSVNWLYNVAPKDGTAIAHFARNMPLLGMLGGNPNVQFDARKFTWLGSSSSFQDDAYMLIVRTDAPVKTIEEARRPVASRWCWAAPPKALPATMCRLSSAIPSALTSSRWSAIQTAERSIWRWSAARCTGARRTFHRSGQSSPIGSSRTPAFMSSPSLPAPHAILIFQTCRRRGNSPGMNRRGPSLN